MFGSAGVRIPSGWRSHERLHGRGDPSVRRPHMPHLYLPNAHTDADLVLAADVAAAVSSADLYVTWTHDAGPGAPEVEAVLREHSVARRPRSPLAELVASIAHGMAAAWRHLTGAPAHGGTGR